MTDTANDRLREIGQRLAQAVRDAGGNIVISQRVGISGRSLSRYLNGEVEMPVLTAEQLADATGKSLMWLLTGEGGDTSVSSSTHAPADSVMIPMLNVRAAAGPGEQNHHVQEVWRLPFSLKLLRQLGVRQESAHFVICRGDSMVPTIPDGAIALVDISKRKSREDGIYALTVGDDVRIKRLQFGVNTLTLISDNAERYPREVLSSADLDSVHVEGKVFWSGGGI